MVAVRSQFVKGVSRLLAGQSSPAAHHLPALSVLSTAVPTVQVPGELRQVRGLQSSSIPPGMPVSDIPEFSPSMGEISLEDAFFKPQVVIFDKDGTLVCFHTMWNSWCEELANRMRSETNKDMDDNVYRLMGYDKKAKKVRMGMLAEKTHPYIKEKVVEMLETQGFSNWEAKNVVNKTWRDTPNDMQIKLTGNLRTLFQRLKDRNIKIAICTSDSREGTEEFLERLHLSDLVDIVVCGDDPQSKSKPDPHNARYICEQLNIQLSEAIMVGDTPADTIMGQSANLGLTIGVLTGVGTEADLTHADLIVDDVTQVVELITPSQDNKAREWHSVQVTARGLFKIAERSVMIHKQQKQAQA